MGSRQPEQCKAVDEPCQRNSAILLTWQRLVFNVLVKMKSWGNGKCDMWRVRGMEKLESRKMLCASDCTPDGVFLGDADRNGEVDFGDFLQLVENYGQSADFSGGDFDDNGLVDFSDFILLSRNYGLVSTPNPQFHSFVADAIAAENDALLDRIADQLVANRPGPSSIPDSPRGDCYPTEGALQPATGDFNLDCVVDGADLALWVATFGSVEVLRADGNNDGIVDFDDYSVWFSQIDSQPQSGLNWAWSEAIVNPQDQPNTARVKLSAIPDAAQIAAADTIGFVSLFSVSITLDLLGDIDGTSASVSATHLIPGAFFSPQFGDGAFVERDDNLNADPDSPGSNYRYVAFLNTPESFEVLAASGTIDILQFDITLPGGFELGVDDAAIRFTVQPGVFPITSQFGDIGSQDADFVDDPLFQNVFGDSVLLTSTSSRHD